jgi:2-oxoglutarate/2-oxoacid ferredoxin oxidoreductase subunit alpha
MTDKQGTTKSVFMALCGSGGAGVMTAGEMVLTTAARLGWYGRMTRSLGPQIRGGEAAAFVRLAGTEVDSAGDVFDIMIAFDWLSVNRFAAELFLGPKTLVLYDSSAGDPPPVLTNSGARLLGLPLVETVKGLKGGRLNMIALGILKQMLGFPSDKVDEVIKDILARHGQAAVAAGLAGVAAGAELAGQVDADLNMGEPAPMNGATRWSISGNEATGLGAVSGGIRFAAAYPITPSTEVLEWMAPRIETIGGTLVQAEDELASINMCLGASFGGTPSMTATSGPGLALMQEGIGLGVGIEVPVVVLDVMRGGPSTGIPTKSEQTDLNIAMYGQHGDAPHLVTAPTSVADCIFTMQWSVHLAEALQSPIIVLSDQAMGQARSIIDEPPVSPFKAERVLAKDPVEGDYERYAITETLVSPMAIPGIPGGQHETNSTEHTTKGFPTNRAEDHLEQLQKREGKLTSYDYGDFWAELEGEGETAIVTWGSCTGAAREALERCKEKGISARLISLRLLAPAQVDKFTAALKGVSRILVVEQSFSEQFHKYLCAHFHYQLPKDIKVFAQPGPLPVRPAQIVEQLANWS